MHDGITSICQQIRFMACSALEEVVIDGQYKRAWHFSEGLAAVVADNGKVGFVNYDNEMVIPAIYSDIEMISKNMLQAYRGGALRASKSM